MLTKKINHSYSNLYRLFFCIFIFFVMESCGFTPIYSYDTGSSQKGVVTLLERIDVRPIANRMGMELRQYLIEKLHHGVDVRKEFDLQVTVSTRIQEIGIRKDSTSSRANYIANANFIFWDGKTRILKDSTRVTVSYNILDQQYATIASQRNAEDRALRRISDNIRSKIAIYLMKKISG